MTCHIINQDKQDDTGESKTPELLISSVQKNQTKHKGITNCYYGQKDLINSIVTEFIGYVKIYILNKLLIT
jgi:hypothetical protein